MPRAVRTIPRRASTAVLDPELRETLLRWTGVIGPHPELRTKADWAAAWAAYGAELLPWHIEHRPGTRPAAQYVLGQIPRRELLEPMPVHLTGSTFVVHDQGVVVEYYDCPEPRMECEAQHLHRHGVIDRSELRRHLRWAGHRWCTNGQCLLASY